MSCPCPPQPKECDPSTCFARFWMVLSDSKSVTSGSPTVRHTEFSDARKEAARLASVNPGVLFYVLETVAACRKSDVHWYDAVDSDRLPF